jgi:hypothetical protein
MRSWLGFSADGCFCSAELHNGGWPVEADFNSLATNPTVARLVAQRRAAGVVGFYMHDCGCGPEQGSCNCHNDVALNYYVEAGALMVKPATVVRINSLVYASRAQVVVGATFTVQVTGSVPDGTEVEIIFNLPPALTKTKLVFTAGATPVHQLDMPTPSIGRVMAAGKLIKSVGLYVQRPAP